jgi:hypothetical protein
MKGEKMVSSTENQFLYKEKVSEGKSSKLALFEIKSLESQQKALKLLWREKEKLVKENLKLKKRIDESVKNSFKELRKPEPLVPKEYTSDLKYLGRIINHMKSNKHYMKKELSEELCISLENLNACLYFLDEHKLMELEFPYKGGVIRKN